MERQCPQCQAPFLEAQRFCRFCGYRLDQGVQDYVETQTLGQATSPAPQSVEPASGYAAWSPPATGRTTSLLKKKRGRKIFYLAAAVILWVALGAGIGYVTLKPDSGGSAFSGGASAPVARGGSYLGVSPRENVPGGAFIDGIVNDGGPADQAGLIGGDLITEWDEKPIRSWNDLRRRLASTPPDTTVNIKFLRDGQQMEATLVTAARRHVAAPPSQGPHGFFGINKGGPKRIKVPGRDIYGVQLNGIIRNNPADMAGIKNGDIVIEFDGHPVRTPDDFFRRINQTAPNALVEVKVIRDGEELVIPMKMGRDDG